MKTQNNNGLKRFALFSMFITSYIPLFAIIFLKQLNEGSDVLHWGGFNYEAIWCFVRHFGVSAVLLILSVFGALGTLALFSNLKSNLSNGSIVKVKMINN